MEKTVVVIDRRAPGRAVGELVGALRRLGQHRGLPRKHLAAFEVVLDEVVTNLVRHGCQGRQGCGLEMRVRFGEDGVEVHLVDDGVPFDPLATPRPEVDRPLEERPAGGLGIHLMRQLMDEVRYRREGGRNHLSLRRAL